MKSKISFEEMKDFFGGNLNVKTKTFITDGYAGGLYIDGDGYMLWLGEGTYIDDMTFNFTTGKLGANEKPDYDYTRHGRLFPQNDATEILYLEKQTSHGLRLGAMGAPHLHWIQEQEAVPVWEYKYKYTENGKDGLEWSEWIANTSNFFEYDGSNNFGQIAIFPEIEMPKSISALIDLEFRRNDDVVTGKVLAKTFDIHVEFNRLGSKTEYL